MSLSIYDIDYSSIITRVYQPMLAGMLVVLVVGCVVQGRLAAGGARGELQMIYLANK
jgi:mannose/fructose/N-acetylgalactosamine-specific phosphotransferase system component IIC